MKSFKNKKKQVRERVIEKLVFQTLVLVILQSGVHSKFCPDLCKCFFEYNLEDNMATCILGGSSVNVTWKNENTQQILVITCQGTNITCADLPQFDISDNHAKVVVEACSPSIMRCVNGIYRQPSNIVNMNLIKLSGEYKADDFRGFSGLHNIYFRLTDANKELPVDVINILQSLKQMTVVGGDLHLNSNVFNQSLINYLQMDYNNLKNIPADAFNGLSSLRELAIEGNNIEEIVPTAFRGLNKLEDLILQGLMLTYIDPNLFLTIENLTYLSLRDTQLQSLPNGFLEKIQKLKMMHITNNEIEMTLDSEVFARLPILTEDISLSNCKIRYLPESLFKGSTYLQDITIANNMIEVLPPKIFSDLLSLKSLGLMNNSIRMLSKDIFSQAKKLITINLSQNKIETVSGDLFAVNSALKDIFFHNNNINYLDLNAFKGMNLRVLDISLNKLHRIIGDTISWHTRRLNLSQNSLSVFEDWFNQFYRLVYLDLSYNKIVLIKESQIYSFKSKAIIDLRNNKISRVFRNISETKLLTPMGKIRLYLSKNPLDCDCMVATVLNDWKKHGILADFEDITCVNGEKLSNMTKKEISLLCNKEHALIGLIGTSTVGTVIIMILIISICARRKKIMQRISNIFNQRRQLTSYEIRQDSLKLYDIFISFAHQDGEFVTDELLPKIENDFKQKVCVHYRDWIVGDLIPDQIIKSVESSRMTIIILTEHFLVSEWSYLEFRTAHNLSIQEGKPRVIIIVLDETILRHEGLCDYLKSYIAVNTYLLWGDPNFWEKLQQVLPRQGKESPKRKSDKKICNLF